MRTIIIIAIVAGIAYLGYYAMKQSKLVAKADGFAGNNLPTDWKTKA